ncbi:MAG TPA: hypothetical protein VFZ37_10880 [Jiangellaceae bacterium]
MTVLDSDQQLDWHTLPSPLAWRERVLGLETHPFPEDGGLDVAVDGVHLAGRRWEQVSAVKTRRRLAALAKQLIRLDGRPFGPTPHRASLWDRSADEVSFRCLLPDGMGGGSLDRIWSLRDDTLVAAGLRSVDVPEREVASQRLVRAARALHERGPE